MPPLESWLLWSIRAAAALGLSSLTWSGEIGTGYLIAGWSSWLLGFVADARIESQRMLRRLETPAVFALIGFILMDFFIVKSTIFLCVAHFLLLFQAFKVLGPKNRKDCLQILLVGFFQVLASCTLSVDASNAIILLLLIPVGASGLLWHELAREEEITKQLIPAAARARYRRLTAGMCAGALPMVIGLTGIIFVVFPRLTWNVALPGFAGHRSGFTDQVNLAQTGLLANDSRTVLWLGIVNPQERRTWNGYLRGATLSTFDGKQWSTGNPAPGHALMPDRNGVFSIRRATHESPLLHQTVTLLDTSASTLFASGDPLEVIAPLSSLRADASGCLHWNGNWQRPLRYQVISRPYGASPLTPLPMGEGGRSPGEAYLQLPSLPLARVAALARTIGGHQSAYAQAVAIEQYLRTHCAYSNDLGSDATSNPVENFLFTRKRGPCGHFASAMALMLRLEGIPCRVAAGYYKGEWNEHAQQYVIRERDAHAWVEAYFTDRGWVSFDPSPRLSTSAAHWSPWHAMQQYWDYFSFTWNKWIIEYDLHTQVMAFEKIQESSNQISRWEDAWWSRHRRSPDTGSWVAVVTAALRGKKRIFAVLICFASVLIGLIRKSRKGRSISMDPAVRYYQQFLQHMARAGLPKQPAETGQEFAARVIGRWPEREAVVQAVTERYYRRRFGSRWVGDGEGSI